MSVMSPETYIWSHIHTLSQIHDLSVYPSFPPNITVFNPYLSHKRHHFEWHLLAYCSLNRHHCWFFLETTLVNTICMNIVCELNILWSQGIIMCQTGWNEGPRSVPRWDDNEDIRYLHHIGTPGPQMSSTCPVLC